MNVLLSDITCFLLSLVSLKVSSSFCLRKLFPDTAVSCLIIVHININLHPNFCHLSEITGSVVIYVNNSNIQNTHKDHPVFLIMSRLGYLGPARTAGLLIRDAITGFSTEESPPGGTVTDICVQ